ncbi:MAG: hypothetical protein AVDCRST_MAG07-593, partial [uncultured Frankineae bacterium]
EAPPGRPHASAARPPQGLPPCRTPRRKARAVVRRGRPV